MSNYSQCSFEYWQPNLYFGKGWVCTAEGHDVRVIFWICTCQIVLAGLHLIVVCCPKKKDGKKTKDIEVASTKRNIPIPALDGNLAKAPHRFSKIDVIIN